MLHSGTTISKSTALSISTKLPKGFVADVRSKLTGSSLVNNLLPSQVDQIAANITPEIERDFACSPDRPEIQRVSAPAKDKPLFLIALSVPYFATCPAKRRERQR
jgi:hypothetical protein